MHIARHPVPRELAQKRLDTAMYGATKTLERARGGDVGELPMLDGIAKSVASAMVAIDAKSPAVTRMLRLAANASGAVWVLADGHGAAVDVKLDTDTPVHLEGEIDHTYFTGFEWLQSFWLAALTRDKATRRLLLNTSVELTGPHRHTQEFELHFIEALRRFERGEDTTWAMQLALDATRPGVTQIDEDWILAIDRPRLQLARAILQRDARAADVALRTALEHHRSYWERGERASDNDGWLSVPLAALIVIAGEHGLTLATTSDYAPSEVIDAFATD